MLTAFIKFGDGRISTDTSDENLSAALRDPAATFWLDISKPEDEEYAILDDVFGSTSAGRSEIVEFRGRLRHDPSSRPP